MGGLDLQIKQQDIDICGVRQTQEARDLEHETMIQGITTRMDNVTAELGEFKTSMNNKFETLDKSVNKRLDEIQNSIPLLFETSVNALLAKIAKWILISLGVLIAIILLAVTRPIILEGIDELRGRVETVKIGE